MRAYRDYAPTGFDPKGLDLPDQQDWLVCVGRNRDSDCLTESNFAVILEDLGGEGDDVEVHRFGHWACGWLDIVIVRPDTNAHRKAEEWEEALSDYPVANEEDFSRREREEAERVWKTCYLTKDRIAYIRGHRSQFEFDAFADLLGCVRGNYFAGYASELIS